MVAAWMSAETGVGPSIASGNQACNGNWPDLPAAPSSSRMPMIRTVAAGSVLTPLKTPAYWVVPSVANIRKMPMARPASPTRFIRNAFLPAVAADGPVVPERDQQVRRQTDALPAEVEHHVVVAEHQQQHRGDEQVEVPEELAAPRVVLHVADRVQVDQRADAGDQQHEDAGQRVEQQSEVDLQLADVDEVEQAQLRAAMRRVETAQADEVDQPEHERSGDGQHAEPVPPLVGPLAEQQQDRGTEQRDGHQKPDTAQSTALRGRTPPFPREGPFST